MRKTKIVCTIGSIAKKEKVLKKLINNGLNVARLSLYNSDYKSNRDSVATIREISAGMNSPVGIMLDITKPEIISEESIDDIIFCIENDVDFIAVSCIEKAHDVLKIRKILEKNNGEYIEIISKINNQEGLNNIDEIIDISDGIIITNEDLSSEVIPENISSFQKRIIRKCNKLKKPIIVDIEDIDSMMRNPRNTSTEVKKVTNAVLDGADALMLSCGETIEKHPVESVKMISRLILRIEKNINYEKIPQSRSAERGDTTVNAINRATCDIAEVLEANAIIIITSTVHTVKSMSKYKPRSPIIAVTTSKEVMRKLSLVLGVYPILISKSVFADEVIDLLIHSILKKKYVNIGDIIVISASVPVETLSLTDSIKVYMLGKVLLKGIGIGIGNRVIAGKSCIGTTSEEIKYKFKEGDILVSVATDKDIIEYMKKASAIIVEENGITSHAAIVGLNIGVPVIIGAKDATQIIKDGEWVTVDSITGLVYESKTNIL